MMHFPPTQEEVLQAFLKWLNLERSARYRIIERPDRVDRVSVAIDYVLKDEDAETTLAVEVSSVWRSKDAGKVDQFWEKWTLAVQAAMGGSIRGRLSVYTPIRVPDGLDAAAFAAALVEYTNAHEQELDELARSGRGLHATLCAVSVFVAKRSLDGGEVGFARFLPSNPTEEFPALVQKALAKRGRKLRHHKELGQETWLVIYNTFWVAMPDHEVRSAFDSGLDSRHAHIDHIGVVEGDPPDDAWVEMIR